MRRGMPTAARRLLGVLALSAAVLLATGCGGGGDGSTGKTATPATPAAAAALGTTDARAATVAAPPPEPTPIYQTARGIGLDGDPATPDLEVGEIAFATGQIFTIGLNIVTVPAPYAAYSWDILFGGPIEYVSHTPSKPAGLTKCQELKVAEGEIYGGCINTAAAVTYVGRVGTATFRCTGAGIGQIWLRRPRDPGNAGFATELIAPGGAVITGDVGPGITAVCS